MSIGPEINELQPHLLQLNLGHRLWAHESLMKWLHEQSGPWILCLQEPYMSKKGVSCLPRNYGAYWQTNEQHEKKRIRALIIAPRNLNGYMITQRSTTDTICVRFEILNCTIISGYFAGDRPVAPNLQSMIEETLAGNEVLCCCDTNAYHHKWGSNIKRNLKWKARVRGKEIVEILDENGLMICNSPPHLPTFVRDSTIKDSSHIDATFCTYNMFNRIEGWAVWDETFLSDHRAVVCKIQCNTEAVSNSADIAYGVPWKKPSRKMQKVMDKELKKVRFRVDIDNNDNNNNIDMTILHHTDEVQEVLQKIFKKKKGKANNVFWWTEEVCGKYKALKTARKRMRRYNYEEQKLVFWKCRKDFRIAVQKAKLNSWREFTSVINDPWDKLIKIVKATTTGKIQSRTLHDLNGVYATNMNETLAILGSQFYPPPAPKTDFQTEIESIVQEKLDIYEIGPMFTLCEIREAVKVLRNVSAPGFDQMTNNVIKCLMNINQNERSYLKLYNMCLKRSYFPKIWKAAKVVLIPKPSVEQNSVKAFRPISLTSCLAKLFERMILARIMHHLTIANVLSTNQHAYSRGRSTETALYELFDVVQHSLHNTGSTKNICVVLFLDITGAFDRTWHQGILYKLLQYKIPVYLIKWIDDFLKGRTAFFSDSNITHQVELLQGCPQGGVLSPILWNILFNDLLAIPTWTGTKRHNDVKVIGYADDAAIIAKANTVEEASELINIHLKKIAAWSDQYRVKFNPAKLAVLTLSNRTIASPPAEVYYENVLIKEVSEYKYLGLTVDSKCSWKPHISNVLHKLSLLTTSLYGLSGSNWGVSLEVFRLLFHSIFMPVMTYGISIWGWKATHKGTCALFDKQIRRFGLLATKCIKSTSSTFIFGLLNTPQFSRILEYEVLKTSVRQFQVVQTKRKTVYDNYSSKRITREVPQSMDHQYYMGRRAVQEEVDRIEFFDENQQLEVHPSEWVSTSVKISHKSVALLKGADNLGWVVYTDASKCTFGLGWSFVVFRNGLFVYKDMGALTESSIFNAEAFALLQAIRYAQHLDVRKKILVEFRSDALGLVQSLTREHQQSQLLCDIKTELRTISKKCRVIVRWVPAHQGIIGNELADNLAKRATDAKISTRINFSKKEIHQFLNRKRNAERRADWENFKSRNVKYFLPDIETVQKFIKSSPSAPLCQIVSGHSRLNDFVCHKLGLIASGLCKCGKASETVVHYLLDCELYEETRRQVWPDYRADIEFMIQDWKLLNKFVLETGRFNKNVREALLEDSKRG